MRLIASFVLLMFFVFTLGACATHNPEQLPVFWKWFEANEERLFKTLSNKPTDEQVNELGDHLREINEGLAFEIGKAPGGKAELDVSADGIEELFPVVEKIVASAPKMKHWAVAAFRQRTPPETLKDLAIQFRAPDGSKGNLAVSDMKASVRREGEKGVVTIYIKDYSKSEDQERMSWIMLQQAIGEYDMVKRLDAIQFAPLSEATAEKAVPFAELGKRFDSELGKGK